MKLENTLEFVKPLKTKKIISQILLLLNPFGNKIRNYTPHIRFKLEKGDFLIKTASNGEELQQILELRYRVFYSEYIGKKLITKMDVDKFDFLSDHLIIKDKNNGRIIGTYRLISSLYSDYFYSESEFDIEKIKNLDGIKLELGRACIDKEYRNGITIALLWMGLAEYIRETNTKYLFGCSSIKVTDLEEITKIEKYIRDNHYSNEDLKVTPSGKYKIKDLEKRVSKVENIDYKEIRNKIPSLLKSYFKAGAVVCGEPALDNSFNCIDYFTLLDVSSMNKRVERKFEL
ncbi:MAG TPA: GNAT family N-acyltransferase [Spirochaetota bacterium]|nr:GNAT family N-acyltransferase [Spirochaetota bacterium]HOM38206.1 GNAT family N-acyltransferase [Spirochaetota bacterium]HPQ48576.1 GNAT family N-acyltransferase [Spirochaetota bacterium]